MLITKFNRLIQSRLVWGVVAGLVGLSMIMYLGSKSIFDYLESFTGCNQNKNTPTVDSAGRLDGQNIPIQEFRQARFDTYLSLCLSLGQKIDLTDRLEAELAKRTWERIATLQQAALLNIKATDDEVMAAIQRDQKFFDETGAFNKGRYAAFVQNILPHFKATYADFERMLRDDITIQKIQNAVGSAAWVTPYEITRAVNAYADFFTIQTVTLTDAILGKDVRPSDAELLAYYEAHTNRFIVPEKVRARYVTFPVLAVQGFTNAITTDEIEQYYDDHRKDYTVADTESTNLLATATNALENIRPLDEVRPEIVMLLASNAAQQAALEKARDFSYKLTPNRQGEALAFDVAAKQEGLAIKTTELFSAEQELNDISAGPAFNRAVFELRPNTPDESFSDGIQGTSASYVAQIMERVDAWLPPFKDIIDDVRPPATELARNKALFEKASDIHKTMGAHLKKGIGFEKATSDLGLKVSTLKPFTAFNAPEELNDAKMLMEITSRNVGDITDPMVSTNGIMLAYIAERKPGEEAAKESVARQILGALTRQRSRLIFTEWERSLVSNGRLEDFSDKSEQSSVENETE